MKLTLGRVRGAIAAQKVAYLTGQAFPKLNAGIIPVEYDDTVGLYLMTVEGAIKKGDVSVILHYVQGVVDTLVSLDMTKYCPCRNESEDGVLSKA